MSGVYRFGPWLLGIALAIGGVLLLDAMVGDDPLSAGFIEIGRIACLVLAFGMTIGLFFEGYSAIIRRSSNG